MKHVTETINDKLTFHTNDYDSEDCRPAILNMNQMTKLPHLICKQDGSNLSSSFFVPAEEFYVASSKLLSKNGLDGIGINEDKKLAYAVFFYDGKTDSVVVDPKSDLEIKRTIKPKKKTDPFNQMSMPMTVSSSPVISEHGDTVRSESLGLEFTYVNEGNASFWERGILERIKPRYSGFETLSYDQKKKLFFDVDVSGSEKPVIEVKAEEEPVDLTLESLLGKPIAALSRLPYAQIMDLGHRALDEGDKTKAISYFLTAVMRRADRAPAYSKMASLFKASGLYTFHVVALANAAAAAPDNEGLARELVASARRILQLNPSRYQGILFKTKSGSNYTIINGDNSVQRGSWGEEVNVAEGIIVGGTSVNSRIESVAGIDPDIVGRDLLGGLISAYTPNQRLKSKRELLESKYQIQDIMYEHGQDVGPGLTLVVTFPNDVLGEMSQPGLRTSRIRSIRSITPEQVNQFVGRYD